MFPAHVPLVFIYLNQVFQLKHPSSPALSPFSFQISTSPFSVEVWILGLLLQKGSISSCKPPILNVEVLTDIQFLSYSIKMQLTSIVFAVNILAGTATAWFFPLRPITIPINPPAPVTSTCTAAVSYKPLGSFLFGPLFPNPWAGLGGSLTIPNCNVAPAPVCPAGQACLSTANPCPAGQSCLPPPPPRRFPTQQSAADAICSSASAGLVACLNPAGTAVACCAP